MTRIDVTEFFRTETAGQLSMSRLLMFGAFVVASLIMIKLTVLGEMTEGYFYGYLGAFTGTYLGGKVLENKAAASAAAEPFPQEASK